MNPIAWVLVFSMGVSVGILIGRRDERRRAGVAAAADGPAADAPAAGVPGGAARPIARAPSPQAPAPSAPSAPLAAEPEPEPEPGADREPAVAAASPAEVAASGPEAGIGSVPIDELEPAVRAALADEPLLPATAPAPLALPTKKARKVGLDEDAFTAQDDILERMRRAAEAGVAPEEAKAVLEGRPTARPLRPAPSPELAAAEARVLERLRQQAAAPDDGSTEQAPGDGTGLP